VCVIVTALVERSVWEVFMIFYFQKITKVKRKRTVLSGTDTKQKTRSHKTQKENDNIYVIPNQRQRKTVASDWEPQTAKTKEIENIDFPTLT
jgi:hypothetical protein